MDLRFGGKKGIFFTLISICLLGIYLYSFTSAYSYSYQEQAAVVESRVDSMNRFIQDVNQDMENAAYIAGFRSIVAMTEYVTTEGVFVSSAKNAFTTLFINGTIGGEDSFLMGNNTLPYWFSKINLEANSVGMNLSLDVLSVDLYHISPWVLRVSVDVVMNVSDVKNTANWTLEKNISSDISIIGFEDPWYVVYTGNSIFKRINITTYEGNFTNAETGVENIHNHVLETKYVNYTGAPNFLMRFENNFSADVFGIESFVNKDEVSPYHPCATETSSIDHIYWVCNVTIGTYSVPDWGGFRIDNETGILDPGSGRVDRYMLNDYIII